MQKLNSLLHNHHVFDHLSKNVQSHLDLQQLWQNVAPSIIAQNSTINRINNNGQLVVIAHSAIVANKIKLIQASLLTALQNLENTTPLLRECKVTSISVKVQVKSTLAKATKTPKKLSANAAASLEAYAEKLGDTSLAMQLKALASKHT